MNGCRLRTLHSVYSETPHLVPSIPYQYSRGALTRSDEAANSSYSTCATCSNHSARNSAQPMVAFCIAAALRTSSCD